MTKEARSLKKAAVLTGLTMVMGGAEISGASAATTTPQARNFLLTAPSATEFQQTLFFNKFDPSLGTLTSVDFGLDSNISGGAFSLSATIQFPSGNTLNSSATTGTYDTSFTGLFGTANTASYTGTGTFGALLTLNCSECSLLWDGSTSGETGLTLTYDYTPVPLPASLPLLATGLGGLGLAASRSRRKQKPASES